MSLGKLLHPPDLMAKINHGLDRGLNHFIIAAQCRAIRACLKRLLPWLPAKAGCQLEHWLLNGWLTFGTPATSCDSI